jgi:hypothetical protein
MSDFLTGAIKLTCASTMVRQPREVATAAAPARSLKVSSLSASFDQSILEDHQSVNLHF